MVAKEFFDEHSPTPVSAPASQPTSPPPKRFRGWLLGAVAAVALVGGAGSGALTATLIDHGVQSSTSTGTTSTPTSSTDASATAESIYKQVSPGVVTIKTTVSSPFGTAGQGTGSGIVLDTKGDILTNYHVIDGAMQIQVTFSDGQTATARLVGSNSAADLAVIRVSVSASSLHPVTLGNSDTVQVGDRVYAIGSPFGRSGSMTQGIVSNLHQRETSSGGSRLTDLIQTDAALNPGNSGGPLVNTEGQVIGINTSIESSVDSNSGVGFAISINQVKQLLSSLEGGSNL